MTPAEAQYTIVYQFINQMSIQKSIQGYYTEPFNLMEIIYSAKKLLFGVYFALMEIEHS